MAKRNAYLLTCNPESERTIFSKNILETVGFTVILFQAIPHEIPLISHKISMIEIYKIIEKDEDNEWSYIFEDDINILEPITLDEIIQYEQITDTFFYLGMCKYGENTIQKTDKQINGHDVYQISYFVRGLHAVAFSRKGIATFLLFIEQNQNDFIDMILEAFSIPYPAPVIRAELESYISCHHGIFFQDRDRFQSIISA